MLKTSICIESVKIYIFDPFLRWNQIYISASNHKPAKQNSWIRELQGKCCSTATAADADVIERCHLNKQPPQRPLWRTRCRRTFRRSSTRPRALRSSQATLPIRIRTLCISRGPPTSSSCVSSPIELGPLALAKKTGKAPHIWRVD